MAKNFMTAILQDGHTRFNLFCFGEDTADTIDDFVEANSRRDQEIVFPKGESGEILDSFFSRVKDQIQRVNNFLDRGSRQHRFSSTSINPWAYNIAVSWNDDTNRSLSEGNPKALLGFAKTLAYECGKLDALKDRIEASREAREKGE
jgi:hypothetical protein